MSISKSILSYFVFVLILMAGKVVCQPVDSIVLETKVPHPEIQSEYSRPFVFKHQEETFCRKMIRGNNYVMVYNISMGAYLAIAPERISKWNKAEKFKIPHILNQYKESFTKPPVIDHDLWVVNYIGHPYQGGFYYNTVRAQGANFWQSSLFCIGQSVFWEYGWEAGMEQPSLQDLITTPFLGIVVGELSHVATLAMSKKGFRWYEAALVCIINPSFAINNGFKSNRNTKHKK